MAKRKNRYHNGGGKKEATKYCIARKDVLKEKLNSQYKNLSKKQKENIKENKKQIDTET